MSSLRCCLPLLALAAVGAALCAVSAFASSPTKPLSSLGRLEPAPAPGPYGPELVPIPDAPALAPATSVARPGRPVDGIRCQVNAKVLFHIHIYLKLVVNGELRRVPAGIGIWPPIGPQNYRNRQFGMPLGSCQAWLSTHYADGIVHAESPIRRAFVLGELFDLWGQPLDRARVGPARGAVTAIVNGRVWTGDPRRIPVRKHAQIQLEVGTPLVAPDPIRFPGAF
jgi:hypothetical protein